MAYDPQRPAPKPPIVEVFDAPGFHRYDRPGAPWTREDRLARTLTELTCHWEDGPQATLAGQPLEVYRRQLVQVAYFHMFERDWDPDIPGVQGSDGIQYHLAIVPTLPRATILQLTPETKRLWSTRAANSRNLAVVLLAGRQDTVVPAMQEALCGLLDWYTRGRADLPGITARPQTVEIAGAPVRTFGVLTHDESLLLQGQPVKGCCGIYSNTVREWRARQPTQ